MQPFCTFVLLSSITAKAHLHQAILANEDALRIHNQSRQLRKIDTFHEILRKSHDRFVYFTLAAVLM